MLPYTSLLYCGSSFHRFPQRWKLVFTHDKLRPYPTTAELISLVRVTILRPIILSVLRAPIGRKTLYKYRPLTIWIRQRPCQSNSVGLLWYSFFSWECGGTNSNHVCVYIAALTIHNINLLETDSKSELAHTAYAVTLVLSWPQSILNNFGIGPPVSFLTGLKV